MSEWREVRLGSVADLINGDRGRNYPSAKHRTESGIPFVNAGHLVGGRVRPSGDGFISDERYALLRSGLVEVGDILLCIRGSLGRVAMATPDVIPSAIASSLVIVRPRQDVVPRFLLAALQGPRGAEQIAASNNGVAQPNIGAAEVGRFRIALPPVVTQHRVAAILDAFDDLIENNRRRVEVLEEMARALYREWFVHFRYPGHENATFVDSALGPIPEGWEATTLGEAAQLDRHSVQPNRSPDEAFDHFSIPAFDSGQLPVMDEGSTIKSGKFLLTAPAVMVSKLNPRIERTWFAEPGPDRRAVASTEFLILRPASGSFLATELSGFS